MPQLDNEQRKIVRLIRAEGRRINDPQVRRRYERAAVQTGLVESGLHNLDYGDADSKGWRQERASLYRNPTNLRASIRRFREEFEQQYDPGEASYQVAAQVQRPREDLRGRYQQEAGEAKRILGQIGGGSPAGGTPASYRMTAGVDNSDARKQLQLAYLSTERGKPDALLNLAAGLRGAQDVPGQRVRVPGTDASQGGRLHGHVEIAPGADRPGVSTRRGVVKFARRVAAIYGHPLTIGTGTNHSQMTVNGNVSDHWTGNAADIPLTGKALLKAGRAALIAAGMPRKQAMKQTGGLFNVNGHQIIFLTNEGGNHYDHLHVSL